MNYNQIKPITGIKILQVKLEREKGSCRRNHDAGSLYDNISSDNLDLMSKDILLRFSTNFTMGTRALAITWVKETEQYSYAR